MSFFYIYMKRSVQFDLFFIYFCPFASFVSSRGDQDPKPAVVDGWDFKMGMYILRSRVAFIRTNTPMFYSAFWYLQGECLQTYAPNPLVSLALAK